MTTRKNLTVASSLFLVLSAAPSSALVVMISDLVPAGSALEDFITNNFSNVTEIRHADYANSSSAGSLNALNGTGTHAGNGAADVFIIGRSLSSGGYDAGDADGWNSVNIPVVNLTSYTARDAGNRMGWHLNSTSTGTLIAGNETTVTAAGAAILGVAAGTYDFLIAGAPAADSFNGLAAGQTGFGGGDILATVGGDTLAAFWAAGAAPGGANSGVATFPANRLLFNIDNDPNAGNNGINDVNNMSTAGAAALVSAIDFATPLTSVPEPSTSLLGLLALGFAAGRRRR
ncbi:PEP-CTERM sorting domain-containing protein [Akkermansiaceae bacterium]|nr:PEP-CTERM sorting domain-containing protein [Akkermansiaceae bacterium]